MATSKKKPFLAALLSFLIIGMGQVYNKQYWKAVLWWITLIYFIGFSKENNWNILILIFSVIDAYVNARLTIHEEPNKYAVKVTVVIIIVVIAFFGGIIAVWLAFSPEQASTTESTLQQQQKSCESDGNVWCNNKCYQPCSSTEKSICPSNGGQPICDIDTKGAEKSIVYIRYDASGCCDKYDQYTSLLGGSGSGVIFYKNNTNVKVLTSRHVVDCVFSGNCIYPKSENVTIRTQDGNFYVPNKILFAPKNLDLAILEFQTADSNIVPITFYSEDYSFNDKVIAIGYPDAGLSSLEPVLEFSITEGNITNIHNLLTYQGLSFTGIQSDALTYFGSSGGGLFNQDGKLMGIITWGDREQKLSIAIDTKVLSDIVKTQENFVSCPSGSYQLIGGRCCQYGTITGTDGKCYESCGKPSSYCASPSFCFNGQCNVPCLSGYVMGVDGTCYPKCGESYCPAPNVCYNNQCVSCSSGLILGSDGLCHQPCGTSATYCSGTSVCFNNQCVSCQSGYYLGTDGKCYKS